MCVLINGAGLCTAHKVYYFRTLLYLTVWSVSMALTSQTAIVLLGLLERYILSNNNHSTCDALKINNF